MSTGTVQLTSQTQPSYGYGPGAGSGQFAIPATSSLISGSINLMPSRSDAMLAFASAALSGVYASDMSMILSEDEKVKKAWDLAERMYAEGQLRGHHFY